MYKLPFNCNFKDFTIKILFVLFVRCTGWGNCCSRPCFSKQIITNQFKQKFSCHRIPINKYIHYDHISTFLLEIVCTVLYGSEYEMAFFKAKGKFIFALCISQCNIIACPIIIAKTNVFLKLRYLKKIETKMG